MKAHGAGLLPKKNKTFTGFPLILGWIILLWNTFRTTFHQGQLLSRRFCRRGSSCRQTNSFPKLLFWQLAKRTWLNLEKLFSEWSGRGKKKKGWSFLLYLPSSILLFRWQSWLILLKVKWEFVSIIYLLRIVIRQVLCTLPLITGNTMKRESLCLDRSGLPLNQQRLNRIILRWRNLRTNWKFRFFFPTVFKLEWCSRGWL